MELNKINDEVAELVTRKNITKIEVEDRKKKLLLEIADIDEFLKIFNTKV